MSVHPCSCSPPGQCRRCGQNILDGRLPLMVDAHDGLGGERLDLCQDCGGLFDGWFRRRPPAAPLRARVARAPSAAPVGRASAFAALFSEAKS